ncbi:MAG: CapA family protein [Lentisphaeria bacterium]|nr:CapA family protein [Lentisphaeria bacterium]
MAITKNWREPGKKTFSITIGGDFCPREENSQYVAEHASEIVRDMKPVLKKDALKILQWECAVTEGGAPIVKRGPNLRCGEPVLDVLTELGIDVALLANNHTGDFGPSEILTTENAIRARGVMTVGTGRDPEDAAKPLMLEKNGVSIAILNICENEFGGARKNKPGTNTMDVLENIRQIREARRQADVVLVLLHGGHEVDPYPSPRMVKVFRAFADAGASAVWNCHTHCPEGFEVRNGVPVIYSPGNFYFPGGPTAHKTLRTGYVTEFLCDEKGSYGFEITPYGSTKEKMFRLTGGTLAAAEKYLLDLCGPLDDPDELQSLFDSWCTGAGIGYLSMIAETNEETWPPADWTDKEVHDRWIGVRNLFTCESHAYLLNNTCRLIEEFRVAEAASGCGRITERMDPEFVTW